MPIVVLERMSGTSNRLRKPRVRHVARRLSGTMGSVSTSGSSIVSPLRILSFQASQASGLGNDAISAASADGLVGVKADRCFLQPTMLNTLFAKPPTNRRLLAAIASNGA